MASPMVQRPSWARWVAVDPWPSWTTGVVCSREAGRPGLSPGRVPAAEGLGAFSAPRSAPTLRSGVSPACDPLDRTGRPGLPPEAGAPSPPGHAPASEDENPGACSAPRRRRERSVVVPARTARRIRRRRSIGCEGVASWARGAVPGGSRSSRCLDMVVRLPGPEGPHGSADGASEGFRVDLE